MPARAPIGLQTDQERLKQLNTSINTPNIDMEIPEWAAPAQVEPEVAPEVVSEPQQAPVEEPELPSWFIVKEEPTEAVQELPSWFKVKDEPTGTSEFTSTEDGLIGLPQGIESYTYSENDMSENEALFNPIKDYVADRFGVQAVKDKSNEEVVNKFLNSRRGMASGNSVRVVSEIDYLMNVKDDPERLLKAGKAYSIFEKMENLTGEGVTWGEFGEGVKDYAGNVLLDPINFVTFGIGKLFGGTALKTAGKTAEKIAMSEITKQLMKGASQEAAKKAGTAVLRKASVNLAKEGTKEIAEFSTKMLANKGVKKVFTKAGLKEVGAATIVDAAINSGTEFLYQRSLVDTNVQEEVNKHAVGLAAISSMAMGGVQGLLVAKRGMSDTALVSETVKQADPKAMMKELKKSLEAYITSAPDEAGSWMAKVKKGDDITKGDTDFFIDLLLGVSDAEGNTKLKGLAEIMQEGGYYYTKRTEDDKMSNWIADFMKEELDQDDISSLMSTFGGKAKRANTKITPETFGDSFANKMNASARSMNSVMQVAKRLDVDIKDIDTSDFLDEALGLTLGKDIVLQADRYKGKGVIGANISETQNKFIRTLVSHPSTSALNVLGYGSAASLDIATDLTMSMYHMTRGSFQKLTNAADSGVKDLNMAKNLALASKDRVKFLLDPDMTHAAYKSALLKNTGALDKLNRVLAGGVDVANTAEQMAKLGKGAGFQNKFDTLVTHAQTATFVHAQDAFTKSQEYVGQMNKQLRTTFGKSWNEFYTHKDASKIMATKQYKQLEMDAVAATMANTFSKSYKDNSKLGTVAGMIEDARNIPGLGFMVPFGRFFNNTIDFGIKNTPGLNWAVKKTTGKYRDVSVAELNSRAAVVTGLVVSMAQDEQENLRDGMGLYDEVINGEIVSQQYDYPISLFKAASRVISYKMAGKEVPKEIIIQIGKDFGGGGLTRNLDKTTAEFADFGAAILAAEVNEALREGEGIVTDLTTQALSGFLRPLEPVDTAIGLLLNQDQTPKDNAQGNRLVGDSLKYLDTTANWLLGEGDAPVKYSGAGGELNQQSAKNLGVRNPVYTKTQNLMNVLGVDQWSVNPALSKEKKRVIPEAVNEYQRQFFNAIEDWSAGMMDNEDFLNAPQDVQRTIWSDKVKEIKDIVKHKLITQYDGPQSTLRDQFDIMSTSSVSEVEQAIEDLELNKPLNELTLSEITLVKTQLKNADYIHRMSIGGELRQ